MIPVSGLLAFGGTLDTQIRSPPRAARGPTASTAAGRTTRCAEAPAPTPSVGVGPVSLRVRGQAPPAQRRRCPVGLYEIRPRPCKLRVAGAARWRRGAARLDSDAVEQTVAASLADRQAGEQLAQGSADLGHRPALGDPAADRLLQGVGEVEHRVGGRGPGRWPGGLRRRQAPLGLGLGLPLAVHHRQGESYLLWSGSALAGMRASVRAGSDDASGHRPAIRRLCRGHRLHSAAGPRAR